MEDNSMEKKGKSSGIKGKDWFLDMKKRMAESGLSEKWVEPEKHNNTETITLNLPLWSPNEDKEPWTTDSLKENVIQSVMEEKGISRELVEEMVSMYL